MQRISKEDFHLRLFKDLTDAFQFLASLYKEDSVNVPINLLTDAMQSTSDEKEVVQEKQVLVFDTETIGLNPPVICQLGFALYTHSGVTLRESNKLLQLPTGVRISYGAQKIHHISTLQCRQKGVNTISHLRMFADLAKEVVAGGGLVVAHNAKFDVRAVNATFTAFGKSDRLLPPTFCLMRASKDFVDARSKVGHRKQPRNEELFEKLFHKKAPSGLHDALVDVRVTGANFFELRRRNRVVPQ